ncbi:hypothetical protein NC652_009616 [Populus alba x Populus x berolinensis]|uniref:Uncharacterized protein n=1 Tax=Populus alba x Populus x berolinensis TaxID=444605 RepID=A0AAD6WAL3_9ROSI|nr:hypothetical protein NC652_009616 [Populus alba x Populus x berolinensis]KAJ7004851.1 hypothetical protein NC653_009632 [Populus alba x Populus x berolinensis]
MVLSRVEDEFQDRSHPFGGSPHVLSTVDHRYLGEIQTQGGEHADKDMDRGRSCMVLDQGLSLSLVLLARPNLPNM